MYTVNKLYTLMYKYYKRYGIRVKKKKGKKQLIPRRVITSNGDETVNDNHGINLKNRLCLFHIRFQYTYTRPYTSIFLLYSNENVLHQRILYCILYSQSNRV